MKPSDSRVVLNPIGRVESPLTDRAAAPRPERTKARPKPGWHCADVHAGLEGIAAGDALLVLTGSTAPGATSFRAPARRPVTALQGVFSTRSPDAPTRSASTASRSPRSSRDVSASITSKRSTARRSSTSSPFSATRSTTAEHAAIRSPRVLGPRPPRPGFDAPATGS